MIATFMSDFGIENNFVGVVKGVILSYAPDVTIVDITHHIPPFNLIVAGYTLENSYKYFPSGTLHLIVVDPGVGTDRDIIYMEYNSHYFVFPDNGLINIFGKGLEKAKIWRYRPKALPQIQTFHGRDLFAPFVGRLMAEDIDEDELEPIHFDELKKIEYPQVIKHDKSIVGTVILVDHFGNVITNIKAEDIPLQSGMLTVQLKDKTMELSLFPSYGHGGLGQDLCVFSSFGTLELATNQSNFAEKHNVKQGDEIKVFL